MVVEFIKLFVFDYVFYCIVKDKDLFIEGWEGIYVVGCGFECMLVML